MQAIFTPQALSIALGLAAVLLVGFLVVVAAIAFFLLRKPAASATGTPAVTGNVTALTHTAVDWGLLTGVWNAVRDNNKPALQFELAFLGKLADNMGGPAQLFEHILLDYLAKRIAAGQATPILTKIATAAGVDVQTLLNDFEGNTAPAPPAAAKPAAAASSPVLPVAQAIPGLIVLCLTLFAFSGSAHAAPPLRSPERFYPSEFEPTIDPPTFASARACLGAMCPSPVASPMATYQAPPQAAGQLVSGSQVRRGIFPIFGRRCR